MFSTDRNPTALDPATSGYSDSVPLADVSAIERGTSLAVSAERHVDTDGAINETLLSVITGGVAIENTAITPEAAFELGHALLRSARFGGVR